MRTSFVTLFYYIYFPQPSRTSAFIKSTIDWWLSRAIRCINCLYPSPLIIIGVLENPDTWWLREDDPTRELFRLHITKLFHLSQLMLSEFLDGLQQLLWRVINYYWFSCIWHNPIVLTLQRYGLFLKRQRKRGKSLERCNSHCFSKNASFSPNYLKI